MHTKAYRGPRIAPCGTPALMSAHEECWSLKITLCFLLRRKSVKRVNKVPVKPYWCNL